MVSSLENLTFAVIVPHSFYAMHCVVQNIHFPFTGFFCFNYAPLNLFRKFQFWFILSFQNFGFWNPHPPSISNNPLRVGISIFWYHTWLFHWSIMYIVFTLGWFRECSGCRLHANRAYFMPSVSGYVFETFITCYYSRTSGCDHLS